MGWPEPTAACVLVSHDQQHVERAKGRRAGARAARPCSLTFVAWWQPLTDRASRQWHPHDVPSAESPLRYSTADIIRLLKQGICNLCFPAVVTTHRVNPKDLFFSRCMVAVTVAALTAEDGLAAINQDLAQESQISDSDCEKYRVAKCCIQKPKIVPKPEAGGISTVNTGLQSGRALPRF